jgi:hypothetical protein
MHCNGCSGLAVPAQKAITQPTGMLQPDIYTLRFFTAAALAASTALDDLGTGTTHLFLPVTPYPARLHYIIDFTTG